MKVVNPLKNIMCLFGLVSGPWIQMGICINKQLLCCILYVVVVVVVVVVIVMDKFENC